MPADLSRTTIALADTRWVGHHPTFFKEFAASLRRLGAFVIALCPQPEDLAPEENLFASPLQSPNQSLLTRLDNDPAVTLMRWLATRRALDRAEDACGQIADLVFFPYLDNYLRFLPSSGVPDLVLGRPWSGLYFRNQHLDGDSGRRCSVLKNLAKGDRLLRSPSTLPLVGVLDARFNEGLAQRSGRTALAFPDITDETPAAASDPLAEKLGALAAGRPIIGLAGSLEKRKGLLTMLRTAEASARAGDGWFFAAVGPFTPGTFSSGELAWIERVCARLPDSLYVERRGARIPDGAPYNAVFSTFAVSWAAYEEFQGSSNTLTKAALFEKPVLATRGECIGERVEAHALGATFPERDHGAARRALQRILEEERTATVRRGFAAYRQLHSRPQLDATFERLIASMPAERRGPGRHHAPSR